MQKIAGKVHNKSKQSSNKTKNHLRFVYLVATSVRSLQIWHVSYVPIFWNLEKKKSFSTSESQTGWQEQKKHFFLDDWHLQTISPIQKLKRSA